MIANAKVKHVRISPRKARLVIDLIRGQSAQKALAILENTSKRASLVVNKLLRSAISNAKNKGVEEEGLFISKIWADEGATWKRFRANAFGRGSRILKRTCHISLELDKKFVAPKIVGASKKTKEIKKEKITKIKKSGK
ncbi:MAG: 50S ribosomal protein L22 [Candidatus Omnitrophica bacterium]|nr:50S ribosomal protein L22 [Candidatus Omnitrophota bacterium]